MGDALKVLPFDAEKRVKLMLGALQKVYPNLDIAKHIIGDPITVSWSPTPIPRCLQGQPPRPLPLPAPHVLPLQEQEALPSHQRGLFLAGDDIS